MVRLPGKGFRHEHHFKLSSFQMPPTPTAEHLHQHTNMTPTPTPKTRPNTNINIFSTNNISNTKKYLGENEMPQNVFYKKNVKGYWKPGSAVLSLSLFTGPYVSLSRPAVATPTTPTTNAYHYHQQQQHQQSLQPMFPPKPLDTLPLEVDAQKV